MEAVGIGNIGLAECLLGDDTAGAGQGMGGRYLALAGE